MPWPSAMVMPSLPATAKISAMPRLLIPGLPDGFIFYGTVSSGFFSASTSGCSKKCNGLAWAYPPLTVFHYPLHFTCDGLSEFRPIGDRQLHSRPCQPKVTWSRLTGSQGTKLPAACRRPVRRIHLFRRGRSQLRRALPNRYQRHWNFKPGDAPHHCHGCFIIH